MVYSTQYAIEEAKQALSQRSRKFVGRMGRHALRMVTGLGAGFAGLGETASYFTMGTVGMAGGIGYSTYINQKEYEHEVSQLAVMYRKEIGAIFGIGKGQVTPALVQQLAAQNPALDEELGQLKRTRNAKIARYGAFGFIAFSIGGLVATGALAIGALAAGPAGLLVGLIALPVLGPLSKMVFNVEGATTIDRVRALEWQRSKGQPISYAKVMDVFVAANPALANQIKQAYGTDDIMSLEAGQRQRIILEMGPHIQLYEVTDAINENRMNPRELAFFVHGQSSGAYADPSYKQEVKARVVHVRDRGKQQFSAIKQNAAQRFSGVKEHAQSFVSRYRPEAELEQPKTVSWQEFLESQQAQALGHESQR